MLLPRVPLYSARAVTATSEPVSQAQLPSEIPDDVGCGSAHSADDAGSGGQNGPAGHTAQHRAKGDRVPPSTASLADCHRYPSADGDLGETTSEEPDRTQVRDGDGWMADVPALPGTHTWAKTLRALDRNIREVIGMVEDLPRSAEASLDLDLEYRTGDPRLDARSSKLRARRREIERNAAEVASETRELAGQLPVSDTAILLGVSKGRITQLQVPNPRNTSETTAATNTGR